MSAKFVNLTPHDIHILDESCAEYDSRTRSYRLVENPVYIQGFPRCEENIPRVSATEEVVGHEEGVPLTRTKFGEIEHLPKAQEDTIFIVSGLIKAAGEKTGRKDLASPRRQVRDENGQIIGCLAIDLI